MKQTISTIVILIFLLISYTLKAQTTLEEYNYVSKGLLDNLSKGQDVKSGYKIESTNISETIKYGGGSWRKAEIYLFKKESTNQTQAFAVECTGSGGSRRFMCIPTSNASESIWNSTFEEFRNTGSEWHLVFMWALIKLSSEKLM